MLRNGGPAWPGIRIKKTTSGASTHFVYDEAGHLVGEYDNSGNLIEETVWFGDTPVATLRPNGGGVNLFYVHTDHLNTPRRVSRPSDNVVVWRWDSDPFGTTAANDDPDGDSNLFVYSLRFPGQYFDVETGLHYNYFRSYDPGIGRYIESDPIGQLGGLNVYEYAEQNPLLRIDPLGLKTCGSGWSDLVVRDNPGFPFSDCCVEHDKCYDGKCGEYPSKEQCDREFRKCMYNKCKAAGFRRAGECVWTANMYHFFVWALGAGPFRNARATPPRGMVYGYGSFWQHLAAPPRR